MPTPEDRNRGSHREPRERTNESIERRNSRSAHDGQWITEKGGTNNPPSNPPSHPSSARNNDGRRR